MMMMLGEAKKPLEINFIGKLENVEEDWKVIESIINVPHHPLPVIHSSDTSKERLKAKKFLHFPHISNTSDRFSKLTKKVCEYYAGDFECFGYMNQYEKLCWNF